MTAGHFFALSLLAGACPSKKASSTVAFLLSILLAYSVVPSQIHHVVAANNKLVTATIISRPNPSTWARTRCGNPAGDDDIPSRWASDVDPDETPLPLYPRPQLVRLKKRCDDVDIGDNTSKPINKEPLCGGGVGTVSLRRLRDTGDESTWVNLNGLWEWEEADTTASSGSSAGNSTSSNTPPYYHPPPPPDHPPFGRSLNNSILVPFPVESCLSGIAPNSTADIVESMWYRLQFDIVTGSFIIDESQRILLHFGAVDWLTYVYLNGHLLGHHIGGYDGFSFDITAAASKMLAAVKKKPQHYNELLVYVFDPSDGGAQPNGKQRASAIDSCGGDTYTPSSGIWQTVWLEVVPKVYIEDVNIDQASLDRITVTVTVTVAKTAAIPVVARDDDTAIIKVDIMNKDGTVLTSATGSPGEEINISMPNAKLWSPDHPFLYDMYISLLQNEHTLDVVVCYFGLRTFKAAPRYRNKDDNTLYPTLNGRAITLAGVLDQSFWPDGLYTAPTDDALAYDIHLVPHFGMNLIRLHQKINPERWYYHADRIGVVVFQDLPQKYGGASNATVPLFVKDMKAAISRLRSHPSIVQWTLFNEGDCWKVFKKEPYDLPGMIHLARELDSTRLIDFDSGGHANDLCLGDVNDVHTYPFPGDVPPTQRQYAMIGEYGGLGFFIQGKEWRSGGCHAYRSCSTSEEYAILYAGMISVLEDRDYIGAVVYTQTTDLECECDGLVNYDRSAKFNDDEVALIRKMNRRFTSRDKQIPIKFLRCVNCSPSPVQQQLSL